MFEFRCGPYYHPKGKHKFPYYVGFMEDEEDFCTVMKEDPFNPSEYQVNLEEKRWGLVCGCPHHNIRKAPCMHIDFAKKAKQEVKFLRKVWRKK